MRISDGRSDVCSSDLLLVPGFVAVAFANKIIPALLLVPAHGRKMAVAAGLLLSARLSLIVAASDIATRLGVLDTGTNAATTYERRVGKAWGSTFRSRRMPAH